MFDLHHAIEAAPLGDQRRNDRALEIVTGLIEGVGPRAEDGVHAPGEAGPWAHTMGSWRFFSNDAVDLPNLYAPIRTALAQLVPPGGRVYVAHDFSTVDYSRHNAKQDRIQVGNERGRGYELYTALVLDEMGRPLGPVTQEVRTASGCLSSECSEPFPFVDHYTQVERGIRAAEFHLPGRDLVHIMDREFDDLQLERYLGNEHRKYVIRALQLGRRVLLDGGPTTLENAVRAAPRQVAGTVEHDGKTYELRIAETWVTFHGPSRRGRQRGAKPKKGSPLPVRVVIADLYLHGHRAFQWVLLTNLTDAAADVVRIYAWRWRVERFFFLVKVGMRLEDWGETNGERIARRLCLCSLAGMAVYQLQLMAGDPANAAAIRFVATKGGWLGRKRDPIGPVVLMRGMTRIIESLAILQELGVVGLLRLGKQVSDMLGLPLPGVSPPLRRPRRRRAPGPVCSGPDV